MLLSIVLAMPPIVFGLAVVLLVLGLLLLVHEFGHFIAAKACGVYCERFSLGMPPRLFGVRLGETDYCIGALPVGGYIKMAGQEDVPKSGEHRQKEFAHVPSHRWYTSKPVWQRIVIIAAGPFMNLVLGMMLYGIVAGVGAEVPETKVSSRIGYVVPDSPAATAPLYVISGDSNSSSRPDAVGWQTGDRILRINGKRIDNINDVAVLAILGEGTTLEVEIERIGPDGAPVRYRSFVEPRVLQEGEHPRLGVAPFQTALIGEVLDDTPAQQHGLLVDDVLTHLNGEVTDTTTFSAKVSRMTHGEPIELRIQRGNETLAVTLHPKVVGQVVGVAFDPPLFTTDPVERGQRPVVARAVKAAGANGDIAELGLEGPAVQPTGLLRKDIIQEVNGRPATVALLHEIVSTHPGDTLTMKVYRPPIGFGLLRTESVKTLEVEVTPVGVVGIVWKEKMVFHRVPALRVLPEALRQTYQALIHIVKFLRLLLMGDVSPSDLGGPIMISRYTTQAALLGLPWLLELTAFISINLGVVNLVPLPVLDGGHLVFLAIEGIRRKPVNERVATLVQHIGLTLIIGLMLFVTFNDIKGWVLSLIP